MPANPVTALSPSPTPSGSRPRMLAILGAVLAVTIVLGALVGLALGPRTHLGEESTGDPRLVADVAATVGDGRGRQTLSVARVENGQTTYAGLGVLGDDDSAADSPGPDTVYELGSITKTFTGMLLADAVERGEMNLDAPLSTYLPELAGTPAGTVTPRHLATHTSGLPRLPSTMGLGGALTAVRGGDPYRAQTPEDVIAAAREETLESPGTFAYSNLGMALLGHAEARAAGQATWAELARARLFTPLRMTSTSIVDGDDADQPWVATPHRANGRVVGAWASPGNDPAGSSTRTTAADMARFAEAVIAGTAPGMDAVTPLVDTGDGGRIGLAWFTVPVEGGSALWHNGGTGGSSSALAIDRAARTAAVVLSNSDTSVDDIAPALLHRTAPHPASPPTSPGTWLPIAVAALLLVSAWWRGWRASSRLSLFGAVADTMTAAIVARVLGPWHVLPVWLLGSLLACALVGAVFALLRMRQAPTWPPQRRVPAVLDVAVSLLLLGLALLLLVAP